VNEPKQIGLFTPPGAPLLVSVKGEDPFGITLGIDGAYWSAEGTNDKLLRVTTDGQLSSLPGFAKGSRPRQIAAGPNDTLWVSLEETKKIARVSGLEPPPKPGGAGNPPPTTVPETKIDKGPKGKVKTRRKRARVKFRFSSTSAGASFECRLEKAARKGAKAAKVVPFGSCSSPKKYKLRPGRYHFEVRAVLGGAVDPSPATRSFRVVRLAAHR
jgi:hypothetical protein